MASSKSPTDDTLRILGSALAPFVERELFKKYKSEWLSVINKQRIDRGLMQLPASTLDWSPDEILNNIIIHWPAFEYSFKPREQRVRRSPRPDNVARGWITALLEFRRMWAHGEILSDEQIEHLFSTSVLLLRAAKRDDAADEIGQLRKVSTAHTKVSMDPELADAREKINALAPERNQFWNLARKAYQNWHENVRNDLPTSLDALIDGAEFPSDLPLSGNTQMTQWISTARFLDKNDLWLFALEVYPPKVEFDRQPPCKLLTADEHKEFDLARRKIAKELATVGEQFIIKGWWLNDMSPLKSHPRLLKLSTYLAMSLKLRTGDGGPDKTGLFWLYIVCTTNKGDKDILQKWKTLRDEALAGSI